MKFNFLSFGILSVTILNLTACQKQPEAEQIRFKTLKTEKDIPLNTDKEPACHISIAIDQATYPEQAAKKINNEIIRQAFNYKLTSVSEAVDSFCRSQAREYKEKLLELYQADLKNGMNANWYNFHYNIRTSHSTGYKGNVCYEIQATRYEGGAHEYNQTLYLNFNPENGQKILLNDIFVPNYQAGLIRLLTQELEYQFNCQNANELSEIGILNTTELYVPNNFKLGTDSIEFLYNAYEIAPYNVGAIHLRLSYKQLDSLLLPQKQ